jgi:cell division control protein 24
MEFQDSLYRICRRLACRLECVPGFGPYVDAIQEDEAHGTDHVRSLWNCFRNGLSLLAIYNAFQPGGGILVVEMHCPHDKYKKAAVFMFIRACMLHLRIPASELFTLNDIYGGDTMAFFKVVNVINRVVDMLEMNGKLLLVPVEDGLAQVKGKTKKRDYILNELVESEIQYVHHLYDLCQLKKELEDKAALTGDVLHDIFLNLNSLSNFAQTFLIRVEQHYELPEDVQNWGDLFNHYEEPFRQYEIFIANQRRCGETCEREWETMVSKVRTPFGQQMLANPTLLHELLLQPLRRLSKYPILLTELRKETNSEEEKVDLGKAVEMVENQLKLAYATIDHELRLGVVRDMRERVVDWKSLEPQRFGEIILFGTLTVSHDKTVRPFETFLFSRVMIICEKKKNKPWSSRSVRSKARLAQTPIAGTNTRLHLKGRIYLSDITDVVELSGPGNHKLLVVWKSDKNADSFTTTFRSREMMHKWHEAIETHRAACLAVISNATLLSGVSSPPLEQSCVEDDDEDLSSPVVNHISRLFISHESRRDSTATMSTIDMPPPPYFLANRPDSLVEMYTRHL